MTTIENEHFNCMKMVSCKVTTIENDDNRKLGGIGVWGHYGGDGVYGCQGCIGVLAGTVGTQGPEGV